MEFHLIQAEVKVKLWHNDLYVYMVGNNMMVSVGDLLVRATFMDLLIICIEIVLKGLVWQKVVEAELY